MSPESAVAHIARGRHVSPESLEAFISALTSVLEVVHLPKSSGQNALKLAGRAIGV